MKKLSFLLIALLSVLLIFTVQVNATRFINPAPLVLGDDLDDPGIFSHENSIISVEIFDLPELVIDPPLFGGVFGFYFDKDPDTLITIFDPLDISGLGVPQSAYIDFGLGQVVDYDALIGLSPGTDPIQDTFTGSGNIGFFIIPDPLRDPAPIYTDPLLNEGNDFAATYPIIDKHPDDPVLDLLDYVIAFWLPLFDLDSGDTFGIPIAIEAAGGIEPAPVPEPATFFLLGTGLLGLAGGFRRKLKK